MASPTITVAFNYKPLPKPTIGADEIARLLELKPTTFNKRKQQLMRAGMPRPIPGFQLRWSRSAILAWLEHNPAIAGATHKAAPVDGVAAHREFLEGRMGAGR